MGLDVSGIGALKTQLQSTNEQLATTNQLLGEVLAELKTINNERLLGVHAAIELLHAEMSTLTIAPTAEPTTA